MRSLLGTLIGDSRLKLADKEGEGAEQEQNLIRRDRPRYGAIEPSSGVRAISASGVVLYSLPAIIRFRSLADIEIPAQNVWRPLSHHNLLLSLRKDLAVSDLKAPPLPPPPPSLLEVNIPTTTLETCSPRSTEALRCSRSCR